MKFLLSSKSLNYTIHLTKEYCAEFSVVLSSHSRVNLHVWYLHFPHVHCTSTYICTLLTLKRNLLLVKLSHIPARPSFAFSFGRDGLENLCFSCYNLWECDFFPCTNPHWKMCNLTNKFAQIQSSEYIRFDALSRIWVE